MIIFWGTAEGPDNKFGSKCSGIKTKGTNLRLHSFLIFSETQNIQIHLQGEHFAWKLRKGDNKNSLKSTGFGGETIGFSSNFATQ